ncbi:MAG: hypothetical protein ABI778_11580 [Ignavibacteriota bacterium]
MSALKAALLGKALSHSISPTLHRELFKTLSQKILTPFDECHYELVECNSSHAVSEWLMSASSKGYAGANITYPFKPDGFKLAERHIGVSTFLQSANCLGFRSGIVEALSTDGAGLLNSIRREYPTFDLNRYHLVLVGAGSAACAAVFSLCSGWMPRSLVILDRTRSRAESLAEFCIAQAPGPSVSVSTAEEFRLAPPETRNRLIIQCTPVGQEGNPGGLLAGFEWSETDFAIDLIYNPLQTSFLHAASLSGAKTMNGLGMLIEQAALSQVFWITGLLSDSSPLSQLEYDSLKSLLTNSLSI